MSLRESCCLLLFALLAACGAAPDLGDRALGRIVVASDLDNLPFAGVDADGAPIGRDVEMMQLLAQRLQLAIEWRRMPFDELLPAAENGDVDVVCATLGITPERQERVRFSTAYFYTEIAVVVRAGFGEPAELGDLHGRVVSAARGTTSQRAVRRHLPGAIGAFDNKEGVAADVRLGRGAIDAAVMDGPAADRLVAASDGALRRLPQPLERERYALALPKDRVELCALLDRELQEMRRSGALAELDRRWGLRAD